MTWGARQVALLVAALGLSAGCTTTTVIESGPSPTARPTSSVDHAGPYVLHTHCGILEVEFRGRWYERVGGLLDDGQGGAPPGWDDPEQAGALVVEGSKAYFSDGARGHFETFELRPGASPPVRTCR
jgi:hypothetical protein